MSLDAHTPEAVPTQEAVLQEHAPHESRSAAHEWRKDDDRHVQVSLSLSRVIYIHLCVVNM